jgi:hypothetical protein
VQILEQFLYRLIIEGRRPAGVSARLGGRMARWHGTQRIRHPVREFDWRGARPGERPLGVKLGTSDEGIVWRYLRVQNPERFQIDAAFARHAFQNARAHRAGVNAPVAHGIDDLFRRKSAENKPGEVVERIDVVRLEHPPGELKTVIVVPADGHEGLSFELLHPFEVLSIGLRNYDCRRHGIETAPGIL